MVKNTFREFYRFLASCKSRGVTPTADLWREHLRDKA